MGQVSKFLRRTAYGYGHWCPGCQEIHVIQTDRAPAWSFDGSVESPTFGPSIKITSVKKVVVNGKWTGEWVIDNNGKAVPHICHYFLQSGILKYCTDTTHEFSGLTIRLPELPYFLTDEKLQRDT